MLDELINRYTEGEIDFDVIEDFCDKIEPYYENKQMLIGCIECYDIKVLYQTLFDKFSTFLSAEEAKKYREKYTETFD